MPIKRTTAYTTSDGNIFLKPEDASDHEEGLRIAAALAETTLYGNIAGSYVDTDDLVQWLCENKALVRDILRHFT